MSKLEHPLTKEERWRKVDLSGLDQDPDQFEEINLISADESSTFDIANSQSHLVKRLSNRKDIYYPRVSGKVSGSLKLIEENTRENGIIAAVTNIEVVSGGTLDYLGVFAYHNSPTFSIRRFKVHEGARADINFEISGGAGGKERIEVWLLGEGATAIISGIATITGKQSINIDTLQYHKGSKTKSDLLMLGVNKGVGKLTHEGMIRIDETGQGSSAKLRNDNLLSGKNAKAQSIPRLEILAPDVICTHAATVSRPSETEQFYMSSRGLTKESATTLIEEGFKKKFLVRLGKENEEFKETVSNISE